MMKCINKSPLLIMAVVILLLAMIPSNTVEAAKKKYVKSMSVYVSEVEVSGGKTVVVNGDILVKGSASKDIKVNLSEDNKKIIDSVKITQAGKDGKFQIQLLAKNIQTKQSTVIKVTSIGKNKNDKIITQKVTVTVVPIVENKNEADMSLLKQLIAQQVALGSVIDEDIDSRQYEWDPASGRLTEIRWNSKALSGNISFSGFAALTKLQCNENDIRELDVSGCVALEELDCAHNELKKLDVKTNYELKNLICYSNPLVDLDVRNHKSMVLLDCSSTHLEGLDVTGCDALKELICTDLFGKASINASDCGSLFKVDAGSYGDAKGYIHKIDVSNCVALETLICERNRITELNVTGCTNLEKLNCSDNKLSVLKLDDCNKLKELCCDNNKLTGLDISTCLF